MESFFSEKKKKTDYLYKRNNARDCIMYTISLYGMYNQMRIKQLLLLLNYAFKLHEGIMRL